MVKLVKPQISARLSIEAYSKAAKEYNAKVENKSTEKLKRNHYQTMVLLINDLILWQEHKNQTFPDNVILNQALNGDLPELSYNTTLKALQTDCHRNTIRRHLARLERAEILKTVFHGDKKPVGIKFNPEIAVLFDTKCKDYLPKSKFLTTVSCKNFIEKYFNEIQPQSVAYDQKRTNLCNNNVCFSTSNNNNITINESSVLHTQNIDYYLNNNTFNNSNITETFQTKQSNSICGLSEADTEEKEKSSAKKEKERQLSTKEHRDKVLLQTIWTYAMIMYAYLVDSLFADKKESFSDDYKTKTINYIANNYFSQAQNGKQCVLWFENNYKIRIDIARNYIKNFKKRANREFDTKDFNPFAYLQLDDCKDHFRFRNTAELLKRNKQWKALNENKKLQKADNEQAIKFYNIIRQVENQRITYEQALEKVRSININEQIFTLMLQASFTGEMRTKYSNSKY